MKFCTICRLCNICKLCNKPQKIFKFSLQANGENKPDICLLNIMAWTTLIGGLPRNVSVKYMYFWNLPFSFRELRRFLKNLVIEEVNDNVKDDSCKFDLEWQMFEANRWWMLDEDHYNSSPWVFSSGVLKSNHYYTLLLIKYCPPYIS